MKKNKIQDNKIQDNNKLSDDEIIIGVTVYPDKNKKNIKKNAQSHKKQKIKPLKNKTMKEKAKDKNKKNKMDSASYKKETRTAKNQKNKKKNKKITKIIKWTSLIIVVIAGLVYAMMSPLFNINKISIDGNSKITNEKIISASNISIGENIFKINKKQIISNIKKNGYIDSIKVERKFPNEVKLIIKERIAAFQITYGNSYIYIDNQGYILTISNEKASLPTITGITSSQDNLKEASRLNETDLAKLNTVLKIMSTAAVNNIDKLISNIDITDENNYKIDFDTEQKTAYLGDCSDLDTRMLYLTAILKNEKGKAGEIYVNMNLNTNSAFFREKV